MTETLATPARRGITQLDVWTAADTVVAEGRRPTIDAVRQQLGRGSPNTVMAHLDSWFAHLADRLNGAGPATPILPGPVAGAAIHLWEAALSSARAAVDDELAAQRKTLDEKRAALEAASLTLDRRAAELEARVEAALAAARTAGEERAAADRREVLAQERSTRLESQVAQLTRELEHAAVEKRALQDEAQAVRRQVEEERKRAEERLAGQERHWHGEVERARGELRDARGRAEALEAEHRMHVKASDAQREALETRVDDLRIELGQTQTALASVRVERDVLLRQLPSARQLGKARLKTQLRKRTSRP